MARSTDYRSPKILFGILIVAVIIGLILVALTFRRGGNNIYEKFGANPSLSIEYFCMTGCPFCDKFESTWDQFTNIDAKGKYTTAKNNISISGQRERGEKFNVNSAPTILAIFNEQVINTMEKNRTVDNLKEFAEESYKKAFPA
jgi:uncharacterized protein YuzB (UPF0349 family)